RRKAEGGAGEGGTSYSKYGAYPPYCSAPNEMERRRVPPLPPRSHYPSAADAADAAADHDDVDDGSSRIVHVTALIRHGSRTPWEGPPAYKCWDGYWDDVDTGIWNCDLRSYTGMPSTEEEEREEEEEEEDDDDDDGDEGDDEEEEPDFMFEKRYDALISARGGGGGRGNVLNGTCQLGQLLLRGYNQELANGRILRDAYFFDDDVDDTEGGGGGEGVTDDGNNKGASADPRMRLWDYSSSRSSTSSATTRSIVGDTTRPAYLEPNLRYRADDEQRTIMSGQVLLRGLFERELLLDARGRGDGGDTAIIRLHTADYDSDVLTPNPRKCPRTYELFKEAYDSDEYRRYVEYVKSEYELLLEFASTNMGLDEIPGSILDCMMTTICTDRELPHYIDDYDGGLGPTPFYHVVDGGEDGSSSASGGGIGGGKEEEKGKGGGTHMFERMINLVVKNFTFAYKYNDGAFPKLGMGPLWSEIMTNILPIVDPTNHPMSLSGAPPPKLGLFSGHDTTLMPILATLGDKVWPGTEWSPYASMVLIEIHEINATAHHLMTVYPSGYAFRIIYNGEALTSRMDGCDSDLCDSRVLVEVVSPFAKPYDDADCASSSPSSGTSTDGDLMTEMERATRDMLVAPGGAWAIAFLVVSSMVMGGVLMWFLMRQERRKYESYAGGDSVMGLSMRVMDEDQDGRRNFGGIASGIDSAISTNGFRHAHGDGQKKSFDIDENELI
ncbi:hypothetical protein ACHAXA_001782, partial [Cyclostephanos tholiformis]